MINIKLKMVAYGDAYEMVIPVTYSTAKQMVTKNGYPNMISAGNALDHTDRYKPYHYVAFVKNGGIGWLQNGHDGPEPKDSDVVGLLMWGPEHNWYFDQ